MRESKLSSKISVSFASILRQGSATEFSQALTVSIIRRRFPRETPSSVPQGNIKDIEASCYSAATDTCSKFAEMRCEVTTRLLNA